LGGGDVLIFRQYTDGWEYCKWRLKARDHPNWRRHFLVSMGVRDWLCINTSCTRPGSTRSLQCNFNIPNTLHCCLTRELQSLQFIQPHPDTLLTGSCFEARHCPLILSRLRRALLCHNIPHPHVSHHLLKLLRRHETFDTAQHRSSTPLQRTPPIHYGAGALLTQHSVRNRDGMPSERYAASRSSTNNQ
jgi:hypothetical protein